MSSSAGANHTDTSPPRPQSTRTDHLCGYSWGGVRATPCSLLRVWARSGLGALVFAARPLEKPNSLRRLWCSYEAYVAHDARKTIFVARSSTRRPEARVVVILMPVSRCHDKTPLNPKPYPKTSGKNKKQPNDITVSQRQNPFIESPLGGVSVKPGGKAGVLRV